MNKQTTPTPQQDNEKIKVLVNLGNDDVRLADLMTEVRDMDSRSAYLRQLIRADYRRHVRQQQRVQAQS